MAQDLAEQVNSHFIQNVGRLKMSSSLFLRRYVILPLESNLESLETWHSYESLLFEWGRDGVGSILMYRQLTSTKEWLIVMLR